MRYVQSTLIVLFVTVGITWLHPTQPVLAHTPQYVTRQDFPPVPGGTPVVIGLPNLNPPTATAVPASSQHKPAAPPDAVRIALNNALVKALLKGRAYRVQRVVPWHSGQVKQVVAGFYHATTISGLWLTVGKPPYHATYHKVVSLLIFVSMSRKTVVGIVPRTGSA